MHKKRFNVTLRNFSLSKLWADGTKEETKSIFETTAGWVSPKTLANKELEFEFLPNYLGKLRYYIFALLVCRGIFWRRLIFDTKKGSFFSQLPPLASIAYLSVLLLVASKFDLDVGIVTQLNVIVSWTVFEIILVRTSLALRYEKGLITTCHFPKTCVQAGHAMAGLSTLRLTALLVLMLFLPFSLIEKSAAPIASVILATSGLSLIAFSTGLIISKKVKSRDGKFWIPMVCRILFLLTPVFPRDLSSANKGPLTLLYQYNPFNSPYFIFGVDKVPFKNELLSLFFLALSIIVISVFIRRDLVAVKS